MRRNEIGHLGNILPTEVCDWLAENVDITASIGDHNVSLSLTEEGHVINIDPIFFNNLTDDAKKTVLLQAIMHIVRGDCINMRQVDYPEIWNIASEIVINEQIGDLGPAQIQTGRQFLTYPDIRQEKWPEYTPPTGWIYNKLIRDLKKKFGESSSLEEGLQPLPSDINEDNKENLTNSQLPIDYMTYATKEGNYLYVRVNPAEGDLDKCKEVYASTFLQAPSSFLGGHDLPDYDRNLEYKPTPEPKVLRVLECILSQITSYQGDTKVTNKTWFKEHRSSRYSKGTRRVRRLTIEVGVDVSGSMAEHLLRVIGIAEWLKQTHDVTVIAWADRAAKVDNSNYSKVSVGGGTNPTSVLKMIKKDNPDVAVIMTDGYFCEAAEPIPSCPVIWILVNNATESDIFKRPIDQVVKLTD